MKKSILLLFISLIISSNALAQWALATGSVVYELVPSPDGNIYAGTNNGIYRSVDNGGSWQILDLVTSRPPIAVNEAGNVFAIKGNEIYRSIDAGESWDPVWQGHNYYADIKINSSDHIIAANAFGMDGSSIDISTDNGLTWTNKPVPFSYHEQMYLGINPLNHIFIITDHGIIRSTDNGDTWINLDNFPILFFSRGISIAFNSSGDIFIGESFTPRLYRSTDNGDTWELVFIASTRDIEINSNDEIFIGGEDIYRSSNNGLSWTPVNQGLLNTNIFSLCVDSFGNVFTGTGQGIYKSSNNGLSWVPSFSGLPGDGVMSFASNAQGELFAIADSLYVSNDNGENWLMLHLPVSKATLNSVEISSNGDIFVIGTAKSDFSEYGILLRSTDNGLSWSELTNKRVSDIAFNNENHIYILSDGEMFKSTDNGLNWTAIVSGIQCLQPTKITISRDGIILVSSPACEYSTYMSADDGDTWIPGGTLNSEIVSMISNSSGVVFVVTKSSGAYRSFNKGSSWELIHTDPQNFDLRVIEIDNLDNLYLGTSTGIFISKDDGDNWEEFNEGLHVTNILSIHVSRSGFLFASPLDGGVWKMDLLVKTSEQNLTPDFKVYPNPARDQFTLNYDEYDPSTSEHLRIYNIHGKLIKEIRLSDKSMPVNISGIPKGLYILKTSGSNSMQKLVIQ